MAFWDFWSKSRSQVAADAFQDELKPYLDSMSSRWVFPEDWLSLQAQVIEAMNHPSIITLAQQYGVSRNKARVILEYYIKQGWTLS